MLFHGVSESFISLILLIQLDSLLESPVESKTSNSCMLGKLRPLDVVWVEFVSIGPVD